VYDGRTIVDGSLPSPCARRTVSSHAILSRAYSQNGFARGASSVIGRGAARLS
jgi:hypothetical protein